jgi:carboxypeptidase family protein
MRTIEYVLHRPGTVIRQILTPLLVGLFWVSVASSQSVGGKISGRVTDPSGAIIPGVQVTAQNVSTNVVTSTQTDSSGYYTIQLPSGDYTLTVTANGFATLKQQNVSVTIGSDVGIDLHLQVASSATVVEVHGEASAQLLTPNTSAVQTTVSNDIVSTMPVEVSGSLRNAVSFLKLEPGYNGTSLNGGNPGDAPTTVDGADVSGSAFGAGQETVGWAMPVPSFAVQEFQVVGSNADASVGRTPTGSIAYALKSGTNQFHGSAFDYNRNTIYDAKSWFEPTRGVDRQNEFGFDLGGPIKRNKVFFYGYYDGFRYKTSNTGTFYTLLTPAMKKGDFSSADNYNANIPAIYDPSTTISNGSGGFTRKQFACNGVLNVICPGQISSVSAYFATLFPDPNIPGQITNNFKGISSTSTNFDQFLGKVDYNASSTSRFSFSYNWQSNPDVGFSSFFPACPFGLACGTLITNFHGDRAIANWYKTFSSSKVNHALVSFNILYFFMHFGGQQSIAAGNNYNAKAGLGFVDGSGFAHLSAGSYYLGGGSGINKIAHSVAKLKDDFTWEYGSHDMQFGAVYQYYNTIGVQFAGSSTNWGTFSFSPLETALPGNSSTGFAPASFLVGAVDSGGLGQLPNQATIMPYFGIYGQDSWKIRPNLTLNYGLRWDYDSPITDRQNKITSFDPTIPNPGAGNILGALIFAGNGPGRSGKNQFANAWHGGVGPRIGLAYSFKPTTVFRAAYGLMFGDSSGPAEVINQQGFYAQTILGSLNGGVTPAFNWNTGFPSIPLGPDLVPTFANGGSTSWMPLNGARLPEVENYNVGIQQKLWGGIVVDASYVGTQSHHMYNGQLDPNQLNPTYLSLGGTLASNIGSAQANAAGINAPYPGFVGTVAQALRPFPQYQTITYLNDPVGNQNYNALQIRAQKTFGQGLSMLVEYTRENNVTDVNGAGAQNYYNLKAEKAVASYDVPQNFVAGYSYNLPIGKGQLLGLRSSIANKMLGGWAVSGIITLQSGMPINVTTELALPAIGPIRPNVVTGQSLYGPDHSRGSFNPNTNQYINPSAFTAPPPFTFGDAPAYFDSLRSFGLRDWDVALMKKFPINERISLNFKGEFFNVLNTVNFGAPNSDINSPGFGKITTINGNPRNGQVSGTVSW